MHPAAVFTLSAILLLISTQVFLKISERVAIFLRLSPLIIGLTIVSIGTSLPELIVSLIAAAKGDASLAFGNIIGSNIINIFFILGVGILVGNIQIGAFKTQRSAYVLVGVTTLFLLLYIFRIPNYLAGFAMVCLGIGTSVKEYAWGINGRKHEDLKFIKKQKSLKLMPGEWILLVGAVCGIILGGILTVNSVEELSTLLNLSTGILGLSITAIVTSLPELFTTIFSERDHEEKITIGNIIGSNIYNLALIGGLVLLFTSWDKIILYEIIMLILSTSVFLYILVTYKGKSIPKYIGWMLLLLFTTYLFLL